MSTGEQQLADAVPDLLGWAQLLGVLGIGLGLVVLVLCFLYGALWWRKQDPEDPDLLGIYALDEQRQQCKARRRS